MPRPGISITTQAEVEISAKLKRQLKAKLEEFERIGKEIDEKEKKREAIKVEVEELFADCDEVPALMSGCKVDQYTVKMVCGVTSKLDKKKLQRLGVTAAQIADATTTKPKKSYVRIGGPNDKKKKSEEDGDDE